MTELLAAIGALALLATVLLPAMSTARVRDQQATCLANLRQVGAASMAYGADDQREQLVPLAMVDVRVEGSSGIGDNRFFRGLCLPAAFGGRTPVSDLNGISNPHTMRTVQDGGNGYWTARRRPLTIYGANVGGPASGGTSMFHCPADTGYPAPPAEFPVSQWPCPPESYGVPLYDALGNSYRENYCGVFGTGGQHVSLSTSPRGHTASSIASPLAQTILYCEPLFYLPTQVSPGSALTITGWHGGVDSDNVAYCDGSARLTDVGEIYQFSQAELNAMGVTGDFFWRDILRRGTTWQADCYPTPGAMIKTWTFTGLESPNPFTFHSGWPIDGYQYNMPPE